MKKLVVILSLFCYLAATIGLSFSLNYCDGKLTGISFDCIAIRCCCDEELNKDCCDGKVIKIEKADEHYRLSENISLFKVFDCLPTGLICLSELYPQHYEHKAIYSFQLRPPPLVTSKSSLYILHSVFRV